MRTTGSGEHLIGGNLTVSGYQISLNTSRASLVLKKASRLFQEDTLFGTTNGRDLEGLSNGIVVVSLVGDLLLDSSLLELANLGSYLRNTGSNDSVVLVLNESTRGELGLTETVDQFGILGVISLVVKRRVDFAGVELQSLRL